MRADELVVLTKAEYEELQAQARGGAGDTGRGWEAPGHVKVTFYFLYSRRRPVYGVVAATLRFQSSQGRS